MSWERNDFIKDLNLLVAEINWSLDHCDEVIAKCDAEVRDPVATLINRHMKAVYESRRDTFLEIKRFMRGDALKGYDYEDLRETPAEEENYYDAAA